MNILHEGFPKMFVINFISDNDIIQTLDPQVLVMPASVHCGKRCIEIIMQAQKMIDSLTDANNLYKRALIKAVVQQCNTIVCG